MIIHCTDINTIRNSTQYSLQVTHRDNWQDVMKPFTSRTRLLMHMKHLLATLQLEYLQITQPINIMHESGDQLNELNEENSTHTNTTILHLPSSFSTGSVSAMSNRSGKQQQPQQQQQQQQQQHIPLRKPLTPRRNPSIDTLLETTENDDQDNQKKRFEKEL
jgi:hypothetical protein